MARTTIKDLEAQLANLRELREGDRQAFADVRKEALRLAQENKALHGHIEELKRQCDWFKRLSQNLSEAVCAYMRGKA